MEKRDYAVELDERVSFICECIKQANASGVVLGNSGGKDSALVSILCKKACDKVIGVIMPCQAKRNYGEDKKDAEELAAQFNIETRTVDLSLVKERLTDSLLEACSLTAAAGVNIAPRLRMTTLYAIAQSENALVAGTGNRSERTMGYFTKWGDGGCDFNPISDLTATEIFEFLRYLKAPMNIIEKAPSAGLFEGQTDEHDMGITYNDLDTYIKTGEGTAENIKKIERAYKLSEHKRTMPRLFMQTD